MLRRREIAVEPQPGRLVMFESWVPHAIQCNPSDKARISIAMNLRQAPDLAAAGAASKDDLPASDRSVDVRTGNTSTPERLSSAPRPFLFNELFEVNTNLGIDFKPIQDAIPTVVIDNFLKNAQRVRELVGSAPAANWKHEDGGRNFADYYDCRLRFPIRYPNSMIGTAQRAIRDVFSLNTRPSDASVDVNWFMQINEKRGDCAVPHSDMTEKVQRSFTCIVYLNEREECSGGTAFLRFKESNSLVIDEAYARAVKEDSGIAETGLDYWLDRADELWERVGEVEMVPGRLLIFPSEFFHAAYHPQNSFYEFPRLTLAFWMIS